MYITFVYFSVHVQSNLCVEGSQKNYRPETALDFLLENLRFNSLKFSKQTVQIDIFRLSLCLSLRGWQCFNFQVSHVFFLNNTIIFSCLSAPGTDVCPLSGRWNLKYFSPITPFPGTWAKLIKNILVWVNCSLIFIQKFALS